MDGNGNVSYVLLKKVGGFEIRLCDSFILEIGLELWKNYDTR